METIDREDIDPKTIFLPPKLDNSNVEITKDKNTDYIQKFIKIFVFGLFKDKQDKCSH